MGANAFSAIVLPIGPVKIGIEPLQHRDEARNLLFAESLKRLGGTAKQSGSRWAHVLVGGSGEGNQTAALVSRIRDALDDPIAFHARQQLRHAGLLDTGNAGQFGLGSALPFFKAAS